MTSRHGFSALALSIFALSAHSQCVDELNAYEYAEEHAINSATAREELNPRAMKPAEMRRNYEVSVGQFVAGSTDTSYFTIPVLEEGIKNYRQRLSELEIIQRNPQRGKQSARLCHPDRPNWASCVSAAFAVNVAKEKVNLCMYEQRLAALRGKSSASATQSQQSLESRQTPQSSNTPEQQMARQAVLQAREAQVKGDADAKKQGRRRHDPAMEAHECINLNAGPNPVNSCNYKVNVIACVTEPRQTQNMMNNNEMFVCGGKSGGLWNPRPGGAIYGIYPRTAGMVHWFACKDPAEPMEVTFDGAQLVGRCRNAGGN
ncbi:MAG: hypothetical protein AB1434_02305 [Pseudomonadota bacterium]